MAPCRPEAGARLCRRDGGAHLAGHLPLRKRPAYLGVLLHRAR